MKCLILVPLALSFLSMPSQPVDVASAPRGEHDWVVDTVHSSVVFRVKHANASWFKGSFDVIKGTVSLDPGKPEAGSVKLTIPVASIDTNDAKRDEHLKAPDFFNAKENPEITFTSSKVAKKGEGFEVAGKLAMAGKSKDITIPVEKVGEGEFHGKRAGFSTTFTVKRSDFGMAPGMDDKTLGNEITLMIDLELIQAK